jgi:low affinity Fe/Cu permease
MVFLIQNTQNRDTIALHLKLDEIIRSIQGAHNELLNIEELSDEELTLRKMSKMKKQEILKNQLIQKAQQYFINIASIFEIN